MLKACAPSFTSERKKHRIWISYNGLIFRGMPTGEHGEQNPKIQVGHIKHMIRYLGIKLECAREHLSIIK